MRNTETTVLSLSRFSLLLTLLFGSALFSTAWAQSPQYLAADIPLNVDEIYESFGPEEEYGDITRSIIFQLIRNHYSDISFDDEFSDTMLDGYIEALDPSRIYFTAEDIAEFENYRYELDDLLQEGDLNAGYEIYNRYQRRLLERLVYSLKWVEEEQVPFDFTLDEYITLDRSESPWPASENELHELWRKRLKSGYLSLMVDDERNNSDEEEEDGETVWEQLSKRYRSQLSQVLKVNDLDVFQRYMDAMTMSFDPHTQYYAPRAAENFNMSMRLSLEGIGAMLTTKDEYTEVVSIVSGGPADLGGELQANDKIVGVAQGDGPFVDVIGWRVDDVVELIRGEKGSVVRLNVQTEGGIGTKVINITRDTVKLEEQSAKSEIVEVDREDRTYRIGVITLPTFYIDFEALQRRDPDYKSSSRDVRRLLMELEEEGIDGVVMDLRGNGGGSLSEANALAGLFIRTGATVQVRDADGNNIVQGDSNPEIVYDGPLTVLVDHLSASASEIFAGAIQDYQRGVVLGSQTFGKGTVQELIPMDEGQLKITRAKFYRVSGESTQHRGVEPDVDFPNILDATEELGESALSNALPWDTIEAHYYRPYADLRPVIPSLIQRHEQRIDANPDFTYIRAQIDRAVENREDNELTLNLEQLLADRAEEDAWRLGTYNSRRQAKGLEPFANVDELDDYLEADEEEQAAMDRNAPSSIQRDEAVAEELGLNADEVAELNDENDDPYLIESGYVIADMLELTDKNRVSMRLPEKAAAN